MQTCPECGSRNEDGELFCGSCGTYLEWEETQVAVADGARTGAAGTVEVAGGGAGAPAGGDGGSGAAPVGSDHGGAGRAETADGGRAGGAAGSDGAGAGGAARADDGVRAATDEPASAAGPPHAAPGEEPVAPSAPRAVPAAASAAPPTVTAAGSGALGGLGGRAARAARRAADQATGGALSTASSTASRARSEARGATRAPGRTAADQAVRAAGGGPLAQAAAAAAREGTEAARGGAAAGGPSGAAGAGAAAAAAPPSAEPREQGASARPADVAEAPAAAQPSPAKPGRPAPRQPAARKPGAPVQRRPVPRAEEEEPPPRPGELVCGACGVGNAPHRHFCRRCGADLTDAPVQPERSWWRRLLRPEPRQGPAAGTRPRARRRRRFPTRLVVTIVILGLLGTGAWYARDSLAGAYAAVVDRVAGDKPINPSEVVASSARADRPASQVRDGILDRSWAPEGDGIGESVELVLPEPARLVTVLVVAGNGGEEEQRLLEARPRGLRLTMTTPEGEEVQDVELTDTGEPQPVSVGLSDVESVRLTILSVYGEELGAPVALAEVELRGRG
ncbi:TFIIB-type zinc ribbon-containing protein [Georgenia satyanarayanai]|uniref:zinc ribbon domain-containing protein n=1 Tax=Georgenia satyanarayanai TaxID=860221 RepID=UPI00203EA43D|nr:zinc ribbon domain-containing protein [Georgenia satyanarayanai]MCM3661583.1 TFIIB-type zinc ribbon-containing protein [Georgenia satyanarayanai]